MRAPKRKRPPVRIIGSPPPKINLEDVANRARYIGSPEHKDTPSFSGNPRPRADASICDRRLAQDLDQVANWLKSAILDGHVSEYWEGEFPRYVWYRDGDTVYEGRLVNREAGSYKGYPLGSSEWPEGLKTFDE
jgi:hypothetical protein